MSFLSVADPRPEPGRFNAPAMPCNIEAEQAVLGAVIYSNDALHSCEGLEPHHFFEAFHGRLFERLRDLIGKGRLAEPVILKDWFKEDQAFLDLGGIRYLADLVDMAPPMSAAGEYALAVIDSSLRRDLILIADAARSEAASGKGKDGARGIIAEVEGALMGLTLHQGRTRLVSATEASQSVLDYLDTDQVETGILTGLPPLDEHLGSLLPDDLILLSGRPGMGKSALASCIALNVARTGVGVIEINSEMSTDQMMRRHLTDICFGRWGKAAATYKDIRRRRVSGEQLGQLRWAKEIIDTLPLMMVKRTGLTVGNLRSMVRRQAALWRNQGIKLGLITVDHVGLLQADGGGRDRYTDQTNIAIAMKALADELHIPVIALVQLSRKVEDRDNKRPMLSDLRDSGAWEENADTVIGTFREAYYANKEPEPKDDGRPTSSARWADWDARKRSKAVEAILLKVREGEEGVVPLWASIGHNAIRGVEPHDGGFL
jgi:replicative DNA helicase